MLFRGKASGDSQETVQPLTERGKPSQADLERVLKGGGEMRGEEWKRNGRASGEW